MGSRLAVDQAHCVQWPAHRACAHIGLHAAGRVCLLRPSIAVQPCSGHCTVRLPCPCVASCDWFHPPGCHQLQGATHRHCGRTVRSMRTAATAVCVMARVWKPGLPSLVPPPHLAHTSTNTATLTPDTRHTLTHATDCIHPALDHHALPAGLLLKKLRPTGVTRDDDGVTRAERVLMRAVRRSF